MILVKNVAISRIEPGMSPIHFEKYLGKNCQTKFPPLHEMSDSQKPFYNNYWYDIMSFAFLVKTVSILLSLNSGKPKNGQHFPWEKNNKAKRHLMGLSGDLMGLSGDLLWNSNGAKLFQHHRRHAAIQCLEIIAIPLSICPAFNHLFSEKFPVDNEVWADRMDLDVQPELGALWFNDVNISPVDGSNTARGRLAILLDLVWDEHGLLSSGSQASLPGKFRN